MKPAVTSRIQDIFLHRLPQTLGVGLVGVVPLERVRDWSGELLLHCLCLLSVGLLAEGHPVRHLQGERGTGPGWYPRQRAVLAPRRAARRHRSQHPEPAALPGLYQLLRTSCCSRSVPLSRTSCCSRSVPPSPQPAALPGLYPFPEPAAVPGLYLPPHNQLLFQVCTSLPEPATLPGLYQLPRASCSSRSVPPSPQPAAIPGLYLPPVYLTCLPVPFANADTVCWCIFADWGEPAAVLRHHVGEAAAQREQHPLLGGAGVPGGGAGVGAGHRLPVRQDRRWEWVIPALFKINNLWSCLN